jgi:competence protein ComEC
VYDTGPAFRTGRDAAQLAVLPYLYSIGTRKLDMLVVSHDDLDHRGGMDSLLRQLPVANARLGPSVRSRIPARTCHRGERWIWDGVTFEFLHPGAEALVTDNETSCVLLISTGSKRVLLTGDIQDQAEHLLVMEGLSHVSAVVAPHHSTAAGEPAAQQRSTRLMRVRSPYQSIPEKPSGWTSIVRPTNAIGFAPRKSRLAGLLSRLLPESC